MRKKPTQELAALGSQAAPSTNTWRSTSCLLLSLPEGFASGSRQHPQQFPHSLSHSVQFLCCLYSPVTLHLLHQGCKNAPSKARRLLLLHRALIKSFQNSSKELKSPHLLERTDSHGNTAHRHRETGCFHSLSCC